MSEPRVAAVRSVEFGVPDLDRSAAFFSANWALEEVQRDGGASYLRGTGDEHHIVVLREQRETALVQVNFAAQDKEAVDALAAKARGFGAELLDGPGPVGGAGGGYGFRFLGPDRQTLAISAEVDRHSDGADASDRPRKIAHVVLNSPEVDRTTEFFVDLLGFKVSDKTGMMDFVRCNSDHHSIAVCRIPNASLNHVAFEMPDFDALMRGAGRMKEAGFAVEWGIGRHGPGNNVFGYFIEPNGFVVEYTAEVEQVDDNYKVGTPDSWKRPANRMDQWGFAEPPSFRIQAAMAGDLQPSV